MAQDNSQAASKDAGAKRRKTQPKKTGAPQTAKNVNVSLAARSTASLLKHLGSIAEESQVSAILVSLDALAQTPLVLPKALRQRLYYLTKTPQQEADHTEQRHQILEVPNVPLTRMGQIKIAVLLGLSRGVLKPDDVLLCLTGIADSGALDTLVILEVRQEFEMLLPPDQGQDLAPHIRTGVLERVLDIATELGSEGREGKPVGALFVIGDTERVLSLSQQFILNPFRGYPEQERNILDAGLEETIKELATIDGAFLIRGDGIIESAGTYLKTSSQDVFALPQGLGARHHAAAAITNVSESVALTVSESTGTITLFRSGRIVTEIEKPRSRPRARHLYD